MKPHTMGLLFYPIVQLNMHVDDSNVCYNRNHDYKATYSYVRSYSHVLLVDIQIIFTVFQWS